MPKTTQTPSFTTPSFLTPQSVDTNWSQNAQQANPLYGSDDHNARRPRQPVPLFEHQRSSTHSQRDPYPFLLRSYSSSSNSSGSRHNAAPQSRSPTNKTESDGFGFLHTPYPGQQLSGSEIMDMCEQPILPLTRTYSDEMDTSFPGTVEGNDPFHSNWYNMNMPTIKLEHQQYDMDCELPPNLPVFQAQHSFRATIPLKFDPETTKEFEANWNQSIHDLKGKIVHSVADQSGIGLNTSCIVLQDWDKVFNDGHSLKDLLRKDTRLKTLQVLFRVPVVDEDEQEREVLCEWKVSGLCKRIAQHVGVESTRIVVKFGRSVVPNDEHVFRFINNPNGSLLSFSVLPKNVTVKQEPIAMSPSGRFQPPTAPPLMKTLLVDPPRSQLTIPHSSRRRDPKLKQYPAPSNLIEITDPNERRKVWCDACQEEAKSQQQKGELILVRCNWIKVWRPCKYERGKPRKYYSCNQDGCQISTTKDLAAKRSHAHNQHKNFKTTHRMLEWIPEI